MAKSNNQKAKILFLEQILRETGENRTVSMQEMLDLLAEKGITAERKSIYDDMEALRFFGLDVRFRRGRPGGYYLAGDAAKKSITDEPVNKKETESSSSDSTQKVFTRSATSSDKKMRLVCGPDKEIEVREYFGKEAEYVVREDNYIMITTTLLSDPQFFGWLTAMGSDVKLVKPKKVIQTYRDYLKALAREYKGIV